MPLDEQVRVLIAERARVGAADYGSLTPQQAREALRADSAEVNAKGRAVERVLDYSIDGPGGQLSVRVYEPSLMPQGRWVLFFHGGGWMTGDLDTADARCRALCLDADATVVSVDYRLAPEFPFPAAFHDGLAALAWVRARAQPADSIAVAGDSSGANIAAAIAVSCRNSNIALACQLLLYPPLDPTSDTASYAEHGEGLFLTAKAMRWYWENYVGPDFDAVPASAAPLREADLRGLAPAIVLTAECDLLRDEGDQYASRLREAGIEVIHKTYPGLIHGFTVFASRVEAARIALADSGRLLGGVLDRSRRDEE